MKSFSRKNMVITVLLCVHIIILAFGMAEAQGNVPGPTYSFVYLGDMHFDKKSHHDFEWVQANMPGDIRQIEEYVTNTEKYTPGLLRRIQTSIESSAGQIKMIVQGGDLTEGLCGRRELQETQFKDVKEFIRNYIPDTTFIATKGNHDITGPGAKEAFDSVVLPWLSNECGKQIDSASFYFMEGPDLFVFFDAYHDNNLDWLEKTITQNKRRYVFVVMHPPAVPYGARSTWHLFSREQEKDVRERFLNILGANKVMLLTGHLHKYSVLARKTSKGAFMQFSMNSVISSPNILVRDHLEGVKNYTGQLVEIEPEFQPDTKQQRQKLLEDEKPYITYFEYADFPGYAVINVSDTGINIDIYLGDSDKVWKNVSLGSLGQCVHIGSEAIVPESPRSHYSRYVNWRPADGETVRLNPPRMSWPYWPGRPDDFRDALHQFSLQISSNPDCSNPVVNVTCPYNFYNTLPALVGPPNAKECVWGTPVKDPTQEQNRWYWRVGYDVGPGRVQWSEIRSFIISEDAVVWDRSKSAGLHLARLGHPRILFNAENVNRIRQLAQTDAGSKAALDFMRGQAEQIMQKRWWSDFPATDRAVEPKQEFYTIAHDLAMVCFVWRMTGDGRYAAVKSRAVTWASYPPGGRASPEGLGGDGNEDATQGNEFLALLFDWLYPDLTSTERQIMIGSLEWRVDHVMNDFSWKNKNRRDKETGRPLVRAGGMSGMISSHGYEAAMDTAVCGLALYEHSQVGREWFDLILNYLIGITCGHGFDEAWNEGAGYGTSKCKWLMNATIYFDTALPQAHLGRNPYYTRVGEFFRRIIPVGMSHHAWGNQANASRNNHLAHFRKLAYLTGDGCFLLNWQQYGGEEFSTFRPWIEYVLPAYYNKPQPEPENDTVGLFPIAGWGMAATGPPSLRSTYENGLGVIFQCRPRGGYGHSFNSDGSFQLHAYGQMLNHGGGSSANLDAYAFHTMSHNTILVDGLGQAQPSSGQLYPTYGRIVAFSRGPLPRLASGDAGAGQDYVYFAGDATRCYPRMPGNYSRWSLSLGDVYQKRALPYLEYFIRHVLFLRGRYFVIYDDLRCSQPATYTWLYHILPQEPFHFDESTFTIDYAVGDPALARGQATPAKAGVGVRLRHIAHPEKLDLDDRMGQEAFVNPFTGEDYRQWRRGDILCAHNLWISNTVATQQWRFLVVIYPAQPSEMIADIERLDDFTVRVAEDVISFSPNSPYARDADFVVDIAAMRPK